MGRRGPYQRQDDITDIWSGAPDAIRDGSVSRQLLLALNEAHTVGEVAAAMTAVGTFGAWDRKRAHTWIKVLRKCGKIKQLGRIWTERRRLAGVYQRVSSEQ
jgi:hypothetical protein